MYSMESTEAPYDSFPDETPTWPLLTSQSLLYYWSVEFSLSFPSFWKTSEWNNYSFLCLRPLRVYVDRPGSKMLRGRRHCSLQLCPQKKSSANAQKHSTFIFSLSLPPCLSLSLRLFCLQTPSQESACQACAYYMILGSKQILFILSVQKMHWFYVSFPLWYTFCSLWL